MIKTTTTENFRYDDEGHLAWREQITTCEGNQTVTTETWDYDSEGRVSERTQETVEDE